MQSCQAKLCQLLLRLLAKGAVVVLNTSWHVYHGSSQRTCLARSTLVFRQAVHEEVCSLTSPVVQERWQNHVILRSSIIFGPQSPVPVSRVLFLQFIANGLRQGKPTTFFKDEFRCPIYVKDIVNIAMALIDHQGGLQQRVFNMGGPDRLSRLDMAYKTADCWQLNKSCIIPAISASVKRGVVSPADISMDSSQLLKQLPSVRLTGLEVALLDIEHGLVSRHDGVNSSTERLGQ